MRRLSQSAPRCGREQIVGADLVLVMESKNKQRLLADFPDETCIARVCVLGILDDYRYMDPDFVEILRETGSPLIESAQGDEHG